MADSRRYRFVGTDSGFSVAAWLKMVGSTAFHGSADVISYGRESPDKQPLGRRRLLMFISLS